MYYIVFTPKLSQEIKRWVKVNIVLLINSLNLDRLIDWKCQNDASTIPECLLSYRPPPPTLSLDTILPRLTLSLSEKLFQKLCQSYELCAFLD